MKKKTIKFISWNVNGLRSVLRKDAFQAVLAQNPDFLCLQETKMAAATTPELELVHYPYRYFNYAAKSGYSGTAILCHTEPLAVFDDFSPALGAHPKEGRVITLEYPDFYLVNVYTPNSQDELARLPYREKLWDTAFCTHVSTLVEKKSVVICGDLNVAHEEIDLARPKQNRRSPGFSDEERAGFSRLLSAGFIDTFRLLHPDEPEHYTWWSMRSRARESNIGWRIDYFLVSKDLEKNIKSATIQGDVYGSDHAPVALVLEF